MCRRGCKSELKRELRRLEEVQVLDALWAASELDQFAREERRAIMRARTVIIDLYRSYLGLDIPDASPASTYGYCEECKALVT
jgi:hypothetical protein